MTRYPFRTIALVILLMTLPAVFGSTRAMAATLTDMVVSNTRDDLLLFVKVEGAFTEKMKQAVLSGISTSFSYHVSIARVRTLFPDKPVTERRITHNIKYDTLRKAFVVKRSWENNRPMTTDSFEEAQRWMSEVKSLPVISLSALEKGTRYQVSAKAELDKVTLPFYLNYVFFFVSLWNFETDWHSVDFVY